MLLGYVLVVGNPWLNDGLQIAVTGSDTTLRLFNVMVAYPSWLLDADRYPPFVFWSANLRTILFVVFGIASLSRVPRWLRENTGGAGVFVATVGAITLSAVAAGMAATIVVTSLLDARLGVVPSSTGDADDTFFVAQLNNSALFGVLLGLVLATVVVAQQLSPPATARRTERAAKRRTNTPKSFW